MGFFSDNTNQDVDFNELRRKLKQRSYKPLLLVLVVLLLIIFYLFHSFSYDTAESFQSLRAETYQLSESWGASLVEFYDNSQEWFKNHGIKQEAETFQALSRVVFSMARYLGDSESAILLTLSGCFLRAFLTLAFIVIACWRLAFTIIVFFALKSFYKIRPYYADDLLGQTGNGRVYYSGIRAGLDNLDVTGAPDVLVPGLACLKRCSEKELQQSDLIKVLQRHHVDNKTNRALASIIVAYDSYPAYVACAGEEDELAATFSGSSLAKNAASVLEIALNLYEKLKFSNGKHNISFSNQFVTDGELSVADDPNALPKKSADLPMISTMSSKRKISFDENIANIQQSFYRVLTTQQVFDLISIRPEAIATALLAIEAGKPLGIDPAGGTFVRSTNFQQLGARAALHSVPEYPREYKSLERNMIRQALIYGLRKSVFGAVYFPLNISNQSLALRQWVEVALACPHELERVTDEVQLFGISYELHNNWQNTFFEEIACSNLDIVGEGIVTDLNMFFVPLTGVLGIFDKVIDIEGKVILKNLIRKVDTWQHLQAQKKCSPDETPVIADYERIPKALSPNEISTIVSLHDIPATRVAEWSYLRYILYHYSWLARRVGDSTVPESCVVYCAARSDNPADGANEYGFIGRNGMVPLRITRLQENWGNRWKTHFRQCHTPAIANTPEQFEMIMQGVSLYADEVIES